MNDLEKKYYDWLCDLVCRGAHMRYRNYTRLLYFLYNTTFEYKMDMDYYRAQDGINLRYRFGKETGVSVEDVSGYLTDKFCNVLEMMVALCTRIDYILMDPEGGDTTGSWFWEIIDNLGLNIYGDTTFREDEVSRIVHNLMNRDYTHDGVGSMFPMPGNKKDMRVVDIWYQAMWYINNEINWNEEATM